MGGLQPAKFLKWTPDTRDPENWHNESMAAVENLTMILSMSGMTHPKIMKGMEESFPAIHFVAGGAWDSTTFGGYLV